MASSETVDNDAIRERDGNQCLFCEETNEEHEKEFGCGLYVHQIIPTVDGGSRTAENVTTLCRDCHNELYHLHSRAVAQIYPNDELDHRQTVEAVGESAEELAEKRDDVVSRAASLGCLPEIDAYTVPEWRVEKMNDWEQSLYQAGRAAGFHAAFEEVSGTLDESLTPEA